MKITKTVNTIESNFAGGEGMLETSDNQKAKKQGISIASDFYSYEVAKIQVAEIQLGCFYKYFIKLDLKDN